MMNLLNIIKGVILSKGVDVDIKKLPSQGIFYNSDMKISISPVSDGDIEEYEMGYNPADILGSIKRLKEIVKKYTKISGGYVFKDLKNIDIIYLFLEIVKLTTRRPIYLFFFDSYVGKVKRIKFSEKSFKYFDFNTYMELFDRESKQFIIDGFKFSIPSIGVEESLSNFLIGLDKDKYKYYDNLSYKFIYFLGNKSELSKDEIDNLISLFNEDMTDRDKSIIMDICLKFEDLNTYKIKTKMGLISVSSINFSEIFKV